MYSQPSVFVRRYVRSYVIRRDLISFVSAYGWILTIELLLIFGLRHEHRWRRWPWLNNPNVPEIIIILGVLCLILLVIRLRCRRSLVLAAIEIERQIPKFDERLITVASFPPGSLLLDQIVGEVEAVAKNHRAKISLRPLLAPMLALVAVLLLMI